jgi:outer membrane protein
MRKHNYIFLFFATLFSTEKLAAQNNLSLKEAITIAIQNSYDIKLMENNVAIAKNNNNYGVAGGLPSVTATTTNNNTLTTINQTFPDPSRNTSRNGVDGATLNGGLTATMILFNGYRVAATKSRLASIEKQTIAALQTQMLNTTSTVMQQYYNVVRQDAFLKTIVKSIDASEQRLSIVKARQANGTANQADLLQSNLDLNALIQAKQNQLLILEQVKADLFNSMVVPSNSNYTLTDSIQVDTKINLAEVESKVKDHPMLQSAQQLINVNQFLEKETKALTYPTLRANGGYNYNSNRSTAGFILVNESYGPFLGLNLSIPIYAGSTSKRAFKNAQINTVSAKLQYDNTAQDIATELYKTYQNYQNSLKQTPIETQNYEMSEALLSLVMERFKLGQATIVDVKQAQQSFETAGFRLTSLKFTAKIAEVELKRMSNQLTF